MASPVPCEERIDQRLARLFWVLTWVSRTAQRWRMSASAGLPVCGPEDLLKDQHVSGLQVGIGAGERGFGCARGQAAVACRPRCRRYLVVLGIEHGILHRLEDHDAGVERGFFVAGADGQGGRHAGSEGVEAGERVVEKGLRVDGEMHPGAGVAAVVDGVVDQQRMAAQGDAAARGFDIGFGGDGVLLVAEMVADVGDQLGESDADDRLRVVAPQPGRSW